MRGRGPEGASRRGSRNATHLFLARPPPCPRGPRRTPRPGPRRRSLQLRATHSEPRALDRTVMSHVVFSRFLGGVIARVVLGSQTLLVPWKETRDQSEIFRAHFSGTAPKPRSVELYGRTKSRASSFETFFATNRDFDRHSWYDSRFLSASCRGRLPDRPRVPAPRRARVRPRVRETRRLEDVLAAEDADGRRRKPRRRRQRMHHLSRLLL